MSRFNFPKDTIKLSNKLAFKIFKYHLNKLEIISDCASRFECMVFLFD
jgi:hypothetical protein